MKNSQLNIGIPIEDLRDRGGISRSRFPTLGKVSRLDSRVDKVVF